MDDEQEREPDQVDEILGNLVKRVISRNDNEVPSPGKDQENDGDGREQDDEEGVGKGRGAIVAGAGGKTSKVGSRMNFDKDLGNENQGIGDTESEMRVENMEGTMKSRNNDTENKNENNDAENDGYNDDENSETSNSEIESVGYSSGTSSKWSSTKKGFFSAFRMETESNSSSNSSSGKFKNNSHKGEGSDGKGNLLGTSDTSHGQSQLKIQASHKGRKNELKQLVFCQCLSGIHKDAVLCLEFSPEGTFLASAGKDGIIVIWRTLQAIKEEFDQYEPQGKCESHVPLPIGPKLLASEPWRILTGHKKAVVDLSWSKSQFLLTASEDTTVRLWHAQRDQCLYMFQHSHPVSSVDFIPSSDTMFASGSLDQKLRVWYIPEARVIHWLSQPLPITALSFTRDSGMIVVGLEDGEVRFFKFDKKTGLEYLTQIECRNRRGIQRKGKRVTGIRPCTIENEETGKSREVLLVSTNDSRIRLCSLDTYLCLFKFKGALNANAKIVAHACEFSGHIISASEDKMVYLWKPDSLEQDSILSQSKKSTTGHVAKKCSSYETFYAHNAVVTAAIFAPAQTVKVARGSNINRTVSNIRREQIHHHLSPEELNLLSGAFILTAGADGHIHIFENLQVTNHE